MSWATAALRRRPRSNRRRWDVTQALRRYFCCRGGALTRLSTPASDPPLNSRFSVTAAPAAVQAFPVLVGRRQPGPEGAGDGGLSLGRCRRSRSRAVQRVSEGAPNGECRVRASLDDVLKSETETAISLATRPQARAAPRATPCREERSDERITLRDGRRGMTRAARRRGPPVMAAPAAGTRRCAGAGGASPSGRRRPARGRRGGRCGRRGWRGRRRRRGG